MVTISYSFAELSFFTVCYGNQSQFSPVILIYGNNLVFMVIQHFHLPTATPLMVRKTQNVPTKNINSANVFF